MTILTAKIILGSSSHNSSLALKETSVNIHGKAEMGMDTSELGLFHTEMGTNQIFGSPATRELGVVYWDTVGYVPRDWMRTKILVKSRYISPEGYQPGITAREWRLLVAAKLADLGVNEFVEAYSKLEQI
ncbi:hypothetical protein B0H67DRAFT_351327 [Lasiosphaeris hirsuta]|uniref:Uncharacterized protein n=1 Tax=Lasiosphaeris hirsuta TaxID=260670 RepID=A0AA39ZVX0_9PEZI|nr:hypothetical protein B0H67DRAFT_351327 [Lasiosphaeris hirsuta]